MLRAETAQGADELFMPGLRFDAIDGSLEDGNFANSTHELFFVAEGRK